MFSLLSDWLHNSVGLLFVIISLGMLLGRVPFGGFKLGGSGVLLVGLLFGHFGFVLPKEIQTIGVVLFVYAVGLNAGPSIVSALKRSSAHYFILAVVIVITAGSLGVLLKNLLGFKAELITGIYAGAMTSTPALAAAMETLGNSTPSVGYGLAYPMGILCVIVMVQVLPAVMKVDLREEEKLYRQTDSTAGLERHCIRITNPNVTHYDLSELQGKTKYDFRMARICRGEESFVPLGTSRLEIDDIVLAVAEPKAFDELKMLLGEVVEGVIPETRTAKSRWMTVTSRDFVGKSIANLAISNLHGVVISRVSRNRVEFMPRADYIFEAGDEIRVSGRPEDLDRFNSCVGQHQESLHQTDIFSFAFGLALGVLVGLIKIPISDKLTIGLGVAGGPLLVGLLFGYYGRFGRMQARMPKAANILVGELGLYLFLAVAGCLAGEKFFSILIKEGPMLIVSGMLITLVPMVVAAVIARYILKMNMLMILGMICGGMTSTPALGVLTANTKSEIPALAYTGIYPLAIIFTTLMSQVLALF